MLSTFLKKLLFVRQFKNTDGTLCLLGEPYVMLPREFVFSMACCNQQKTRDIAEEAFFHSMGMYAKKIKGSPNGTLQMLTDIFHSYGLGRLTIVKLANKVAIVRIHEGSKHPLTLGTLAGMFRIILKGKVNIKEQRDRSGYTEYTINKVP